MSRAEGAGIYIDWCIIGAQRGLDFQLLLAQGDAKGEGDRTQNKNRNRKRVRRTISFILVEHLQKTHKILSPKLLYSFIM